MKERNDKWDKEAVGKVNKRIEVKLQDMINPSVN